MDKLHQFFFSFYLTGQYTSHHWQVMTFKKIYWKEKVITCQSIQARTRRRTVLTQSYINFYSCKSFYRQISNPHEATRRCLNYQFQRCCIAQALLLDSKAF